MGSGSEGSLEGEMRVYTLMSAIGGGLAFC